MNKFIDEFVRYFNFFLNFNNSFNSLNILIA